MVYFFSDNNKLVYAFESLKSIEVKDVEKISWLLEAEHIEKNTFNEIFLGPRKETVTPWSTNVVEILKKMGVSDSQRVERFELYSGQDYDKMLLVQHQGLSKTIFKTIQIPEEVIYLEDIAAYNKQEELALEEDEIKYLNQVSKELGRKLTDSEVFGFSQVNSEHCRHKIFNAKFIIDLVPKADSLFSLIKKTAKVNPNTIVSAYKDNVSFVEGPTMIQFAPVSSKESSKFEIKPVDTVLSLKAETHNFPTTVEPFNGAATGSGGEIRDRMAGGKGSIPLSGSAVYMTAYPRIDKNRSWEAKMSERDWLYQSPKDILIKASNGASDYGNKFGQPLINGSLATFEQNIAGELYGYDKVIMLAGGVGYGLKKDAFKQQPKKGDKIVVLGGDNYRIGMGGSSVSSMTTGGGKEEIELNAIQRSNPEMQKRVANVIRALSESKNNFITSIHDHGAGGHLNSLSELVEEVGGSIDLRKFPIGDVTLSAKEIIGNESQERMGLIVPKENITDLEAICLREEAPFYVVGEITEDKRFTIYDSENLNKTPLDLSLEHMFGSVPRMVIDCNTVETKFKPLSFTSLAVHQYLLDVLSLESVACKDWLTNKVDRSVTGKVATQQTVGPLQLPLNNLGVMALDFDGKEGIATAVGHNSVVGLVSAKIGSFLSITEALTNIVWAPLKGAIKAVSLSANWMWPTKKEGEPARLYEAVEAVSTFCSELGINVPTGKDSLSMVQQYDDKKVYAPGTLIITASGSVEDVRKTISPCIDIETKESYLIYVDFAKFTKTLGGTALAQILGQIGGDYPTPINNNFSEYVVKTFNSLQELIKAEKILAGHDVSSGGVITTLLEMSFPNLTGGMEIDLTEIGGKCFLSSIFNESPAVIIQVEDKSIVSWLIKKGIDAFLIGKPIKKRTMEVSFKTEQHSFDIAKSRDAWYKTSYLFDTLQINEKHALDRYKNYKLNPLKYELPHYFSGKLTQYPNLKIPSRSIKMGIIREKGVNGDRELAYAFYLAGFEVKDIHMTDLILGREDLSDLNMIAFVGGFSNSDVTGSAKGWAAAFSYNSKAKLALDNFKNREDTLMLGVCNGCQLMVRLGLLNNKGAVNSMKHNTSGKFESSFLTVEIPKSNSIMLNNLSGSTLGIWLAHGEGRFDLPEEEANYQIAVRYISSDYPANPNGSDYNAAALCSEDGRNLAIMPHLERTIFPWQCAYYPKKIKETDVTLWFQAFVNAYNWIKEKHNSNKNS